ncbi:type II secretion system F family protein [Sphingorhabdus sp.]|uniref:type II secretion system F family protein n=1 Tax=Sphingorhabdus sp. TaxID=1902408 RepID=UPI00391906B7
MNPTITRLIILILVFVAVFLLAELAISAWRRRSTGTRAINKRLRMIEGGMDREIVTSKLRKSQPLEFARGNGIIGKTLQNIQKAVIASGVAMPAHQMMLAMALGSALVTVIVIIGAAIAGYTINFGSIQLALVVGLSIGLGIPLIVLSRMASKRRQKMQEQFPVALDIFIRGLRSGHPVSSALDLLTKEMEDPLGSEFGLVLDEVAYGADLRDALQSMADRWGLEDIQMFVVSLSVQNETGGNLAEILANLASVIRERASMYMKVRALSSEGRMTALVLTALPVMTISGLFLLNPSFYLDVAQDPIFVPGFLGLVVLYFIGFFTIRRMIDLKV